MRSLYVEDIPGIILLTKAHSRKDTSIPKRFTGKNTMRKFIGSLGTLNKKESLIGTLLQEKWLIFWTATVKISGEQKDH